MPLCEETKSFLQFVFKSPGCESSHRVQEMCYCLNAINEGVSRVESVELENRKD